MMKCSIITATRNSANFLSSAIDSINQQTYNSIEHIFVDAASTDNTCNIINSNSSIEFVLSSQKGNGIYDALNQGVDIATGDVIGFLHSDDYYPSNDALASVMELFNFNPKLDIVYGNLEYVSKSNFQRVIRYWRSGTFKKNSLKFGWMPPHPACFINSKVFKRIGKFNESFQIASDYDFLLRLLMLPDIRIYYIDKVLIRMRLGGESNRNLGKVFKKSKEDFKILRSHGLNPFFGILGKNLSKIKQFFPNLFH